MRQLIYLLTLFVLSGSGFAGEQAQKETFNYWEHKLNLNTDWIIRGIPDSLVRMFVKAEECYQHDDRTGDIVNGATRRYVNGGQTKGWLYIVISKESRQKENGVDKSHHWLEIEKILIFEVPKEKKK